MEHPRTNHSSWWRGEREQIERQRMSARPGTDGLRWNVLRGSDITHDAVEHLCRLKAIGKCHLDASRCSHAVPHIPVRQRTGGTCAGTGPCAVFGNVQCDPMN